MTTELPEGYKIQKGSAGKWRWVKTLLDGRYSMDEWGKDTGIEPFEIIYDKGYIVRSREDALAAAIDDAQTWEDE